MSGPSSEGQPSVSSEPSITSSHTLNSRNSAYQDNGEGNSSQRANLSAARHSSGGEDGSPLSVDAIEEEDFAHRKQRHRKSGGFLLDSTFGGGPRSRQSYNGAYVVDAKGKRISQYGHAQDEHRNHDKIGRGNSGASSSPLSREVKMTDQSTSKSNYRADSLNIHGLATGPIQVAKRRSAQGVQSTAHDRDVEPAPIASPAAIDPNQIVNMALNLSESRRRNLASGQLLTPQPRVSSGMGLDGSFHSQGTGGSLRQYLNEQRRNSRNISPSGKDSSPRHMSTSVQRSGALYIQGRPFVPSEATLARRDKARDFFELRMEYLRLLDLLPPLKPDSSEPGNFIVSANNMPGSPHAQLTRVPSYAGKRYELGRQYNPLQSLRNRRTRARERKTLDHQPEEFAHVDQVRDWVDRVEREARYPHYRQTDSVVLPGYQEKQSEPSATNQPIRSHMTWMFTSEELLADAYWMELGHNKAMIEDRYGFKIFPPKEPPRQQNFLQARPSKEYPEKRRRSWIDGVPVMTADPATGDESETASDRGRKRRLLPTFRAESPKHKKHGKLIHGHHTGRDSDSSDSDPDTGRHRQRKWHKLSDLNKDAAQLELSMRQLMEKEAQETQLKSKSPAVFTPDTPDKWGREYGDAGGSVRSSLDVPESSNWPVKTNTDMELKSPPMIRVGPNLDGTMESRSSFEGSTAPSTPLHQRQFPHNSGDLSPAVSRAGSFRKSKKSKLDIFRSDENKHHHKHEQNPAPDSASSDKRQSSRQASEDADDGTGIGAAILAAPGTVKNLLGHRKNESVNSLQSPIKEPHSAVTRFFKGVKHEGSKVQEFIFRKDRPLDNSDTEAGLDCDAAPDEAADNDATKQEQKYRPNFARSTTAETMGSTTSRKTGHYHLELPSFRSPHQQKIEEDDGYTTDPYISDHVTRQARERADNRPSRFGQLAPPPMDLSKISSKETRGQDRISRVLAHPGGVGLGGLPVTALAQGDMERTPSRPKLEGKRHWSITDENGNVIRRRIASTVVTSADIARVRALFLCSGVKAKSLGDRALEVREPPVFLKRAAETANAQLYPVPKKEEHVLAARLLVNNIESTTSALEASATTFRDGIVSELTSLITNLRSQIESDLFPRVRSSGDEAVAVTSEVSSSAPLTVKQVTDEIDRMLRIRRRRMRWVRRLGWTMVEWMLLGVMWFAWLTVTVGGAFARVFGFFWRIVKWLFWV
ncbi:hypothetical protein CC80DRAFT_468503 [Byssothecium circinans]|uniref:Uncharacterized protein n=1 Tax=Byssothecium circinans TaxID=147558 RepID=A0A6A5U1S2_9PLEO|nr:hypothetical protein CC80DRAFT_468503 [Byssothecium circinans]